MFYSIQEVRHTNVVRKSLFSYWFFHTSTNRGDPIFSPLNLTSILCLPASWGMKFALIFFCGSTVETWLLTRPPFTIISRLPNPAPLVSTKSYMLVNNLNIFRISYSLYYFDYIFVCFSFEQY